MIFANILSEMKRILILLVFFTLGMDANGAVLRGNSGTVRQGVSSQRVSTSGASVRSGTTRLTSARSATTPSGRGAVQSRSSVNQKTRTVRSAKNTALVSRAVTTTSQVSEVLSGTNVGAAYDKCKAAYFACMDQFCELKNDDYRRCSCSARVNNLTDLRNSLQDAGDQLNVFTENLEIVGMTAEQATAMRTPSDGENALTSDKSASATILQAIMNSIRGEKADVSGKYSSLNSLDLSFDTVNAFGTSDVGQIVAQYNGQELYNAVYSQCRQAVKADCTDTALQRAVTAYLMGIEQDCNTVQTAIEKKQTELKGVLREGSAMLDLARIENRQKHNSDDFTTCLNNVESAILSEEVCGSDYHRCLDNGEYIDISTGAPIKGVVDFYKLQEMLTFAPDVELANQKLSKVYNNQLFVNNFENRVKKFALPALDKCTENADDVWADYLDKALLDIYYAQQSKVAEIKQGCFDFVAQCYMNADASITDAMKEIIGDSRINVQPYAIELNNEICKNYVSSCDNMFGGDSTNGKKNIIAQFIDERKETDTLTACRAVVKQCFDSFGGVNYENFYSPYSGLASLDWFTLYDTDGNVVSECAKQVQNISPCHDLVEQVFGGFDHVNKIITFTPRGGSPRTRTESLYGYCPIEKTCKDIEKNTDDVDFIHRGLRPIGVATEIYNQIIDILTTDCNNKNGSFIKSETLSDVLTYEYYKKEDSGYKEGYECVLTGNGKYSEYTVIKNENMCPRGYSDYVDTSLWGACLCWEKEEKGRRFISNNGQEAKCRMLSAADEITKCVKLTLDANGGTFDDGTATTKTVYVRKGEWDKGALVTTLNVYSDIISCAENKGKPFNDEIKVQKGTTSLDGWYGVNEEREIISCYSNEGFHKHIDCRLPKAYEIYGDFSLEADWCTRYTEINPGIYY